MGSPSQVQTRTRLPRGRLVGRDRERGMLRRLLNGARGGDGGCLVGPGEPGVGKTALVGGRGERGVPFRVLRGVWGGGGAGGMALGGWGVRGVEPLGPRDARTLLESVLPAGLDERVLDRIVAETRGNPLALLELPRGLTPTQLAGGFGLPVAVPLSASIEESFTRRLAGLPGDARRLLLVAAADPVGDTALVWRAARQLGIPESVVGAVEAEGLLEVVARVVFRHPLVRSAVYLAPGLKEPRAAHPALGPATA